MIVEILRWLGLVDDKPEPVYEVVDVKTGKCLYRGPHILNNQRSVVVRSVNGTVTYPREHVYVFKIVKR